MTERTFAVHASAKSLEAREARLLGSFRVTLAASALGTAEREYGASRRHVKGSFFFLRVCEAEEYGDRSRGDMLQTLQQSLSRRVSDDVESEARAFLGLPRPDHEDLIRKMLLRLLAGALALLPASLLRPLCQLRVPGACDNGPLLAALLAGSAVEVEHALSGGLAALDTLDADGLAPHHAACLFGDIAVVSVLARHGASLDLPSSTGMTCVVRDRASSIAVKSLGGGPTPPTLLPVDRS